MLLNNEPMVTLRLRQRKKSHLVLGIIFILALLIVVVFFPPEEFLIKFLFFLLLFAALFYLLRFALNPTRRALLISAGITLLLLLRALGLRHWLYPLLIVALILSVEIYARRE